MVDNKLINKILKSGEIIVVGVSGGQDSVALLHFLHSLHFPILVASFDHCLRPDSQADIDFVRNFAITLGLPFVSDSADVAMHASSHGKSIEEAARDLRYKFLFTQANKSGAQAVAVGHTADDQSETVLMHFLRGAGIPGLKGMPFSIILPIFDSKIPLVRPLLNWTREDTEDYCFKHNLATITDQTNFDMTYFRNRLRHQLIPALKQYNPQISNTLAKTAQALQGDYDLINGLVESAWQKAIKQTGEFFIEFDLIELKKLNPALLRYVLRKGALTIKPGLRDIDFDALERASTLKAVDLAGGLKTHIEANRFYITPSEDLLPAEHRPQLKGQIPLTEGCFQLEDSWIITCHQITEFDFQGQVKNNTNPFVAWIDSNNNLAGLSLRTYLSGDRIQPLGMPNQTIKLTELFINLKIPKRLRSHWPILYVGDKIAWVPGLRLAEDYKVTENTGTSLIIELFKAKTGLE